MNATLTLDGPRYTRIIKDAMIDAEDFDALPAAPLPHDAFESFVAVAQARHLAKRPALRVVRSHRLVANTMRGRRK